MIRSLPAAALLAALFAAACLFASGCRENMWWEYRDDPYLAAMAKGGENDMLRNINSVYEDNRQAALRLAAHRVGEYRRAGRVADAERLEGVIIRRYQIEKEPAVRLCIIRICAPACGTGSTAMVKFLRARVAAGDYPGHAALSLAELRPRGVVADILPLTRHPAPEVRYQAAVALAMLGDPGGYPDAARILKSMDSAGWPAVVDGIPLGEAKASLDQWIRRGFGQGPR